MSEIRWIAGTNNVDYNWLDGLVHCPDTPESRYTVKWGDDGLYCAFVEGDGELGDEFTSLADAIKACEKDYLSRSSY